MVDKEEEAARNNRNVTLRKLRVLLEKVGDVEIISDMGFLCIRWGEGVFCDYRMALECIRQFKEKNEEHGDNDDGDVGEHEHREGDGVENFLGGGAIDIVPLGDGGDNTKDEHGEVQAQEALQQAGGQH